MPRNSSHLRPTVDDGRPTIAYLIGTLGTGGAEVLVRDWISRLHGRDVRCVVICLIEKRGAIVSELEELGVPVHEVRQAETATLLFCRRLAAVLRQCHAALIHSQCPWSLPQQTYSAKAGGAAGFVLSVHSVYNTKPLPVRLRQRLAFVLAEPMIDAVVGVSRAVTDHIGRNFHVSQDKAKTIHNGIQIERFLRSAISGEQLRMQLGLPTHSPLVVSTANLTPQKGHSVLLKSFRIIADAVPDVRLLLIGDGPLRTDLEAVVHDEGLSGAVSFLGHRDDVPRLLHASDLFALASYREGFGLAVAEAHAAGLPVVATRVGGVPEVVRDGETGFLVPAGDPKALAEAILAMLADRNRAKAMGQQGREWVMANFDIDVCTAKYEELYREILARKGR